MHRLEGGGSLGAGAGGSGGGVGASTTGAGGGVEVSAMGADDSVGEDVTVVVAGAGSEATTTGCVVTP